MDLLVPRYNPWGQPPIFVCEELLMVVMSGKGDAVCVVEGEEILGLQSKPAIATVFK